MNQEQIAKLKEVALKAPKNPGEWPFYLRSFQAAASPEVVLELIAIAERTTAPVSLTDAKIEELAIKHESFGFGQAGKKSKLSIHGFEPEGLREFARALLAAAPAPIQQVPTLIAYVATDLDGHYDVGTTPEKAKQRAGHGCDTVFPIYDIGDNATPPALAGSQVQDGD